MLTKHISVQVCIIFIKHFRACKNTFACLDIPKQIIDLMDEKTRDDGQPVNSACESQLGTTGGPYFYGYDEIFPAQVQNKLDTTGK